MGNEVSHTTVRAALTQPSATFATVEHFLKGTSPDNSLIKGRGVLAGFPSQTETCNIHSTSEKAWVLPAYLPSNTNEEIDGMVFPDVWPGDIVIFSVVRIKGSNYFAKIDLVKSGSCGSTIHRHGYPRDFRVTYSSYIRCCGINAQSEQHAHFSLDPSLVFKKFFAGLKVRWRAEVLCFLERSQDRMKVKARILTAANSTPKEHVVLEFSGSSLASVSNVKESQFIDFAATIVKQGGQFFFSHTLNVFHVYRVAERPILSRFDDSDTSDEELHQTTSQTQDADARLRQRATESSQPQASEPATTHAAPSSAPSDGSAHNSETRESQRAECQDAPELGDSQPSTVLDIREGTDSDRQGGSRRRSRSSGPADDLDSQCVICQDEQRTHAFIPCGHRCACQQCAEQILHAGSRRACPICRRKIAKSIRIWN